MRASLLAAIMLLLASCDQIDQIDQRKTDLERFLECVDRTVAEQYQEALHESCTQRHEKRVSMVAAQASARLVSDRSFEVTYHNRSEDVVTFLEVALMLPPAGESTNCDTDEGCSTRYLSARTWVLPKETRTVHFAIPLGALSDSPADIGNRWAFAIESTRVIAADSMP